MHAVGEDTVYCILHIVLVGACDFTATPASDDPLIDRYDTEQPKSPLYAAEALSAADPS